MRLRRGRECHYCGTRNQPQNLQRFNCVNCLADNFYDENGEIADVPPEVAQAPASRYVVPVSHDTSGSIFCAVCQKNQNLYTEALSEFLPDPSSPNYAQYEAALPEFKKRMELQYPQCCTTCAPKVKEQLLQATYTARSDHLRRVLDKSRSSKPMAMLQWRFLVVTGAKLLYYTSLVVQLTWHLLESQALTTTLQFVRPVDCLSLTPAVQCSGLIEPVVGPALVVGLFCAWWNPTWQHKLQRLSGRLTGLVPYYWMQTALMVIRFASWVIAKDLPMSDQYRRMLHSVSVVLLIVIASYANFGTITIDNAPLVNWQQDTAPLVVDGQFTSPMQTQHQIPAMGLDTLQTVRPYLQSWNPPTPPDEDDMDWTPSLASFSPQPKPPAHKPPQPSPFIGTVPALSRPGIYGRRSQTEPEPVKAIGIPQGFFENRAQLPTSDTRLATFAPPKFFANSNDTGLEGMFGKVFSLDEDIPEIRETRNEPESTQALNGSISQDIFSWDQIFRIMTFMTAGSAAASTTLNTYLGKPVDDRLIPLLVLVPVANIIHDLLQGFSVMKLAAWTFTCVEIAALSYLRPDEQSLLMPLWSKLIVATAYLLAAHEILFLCAASSRSSSERAFSPAIRNGSQITGLPYQPPQPSLADVPSTPQHSLFRRDSTESIASSASTMSTSTASTWRTPIRNYGMTPRVTRSMRSDRTRDNIFGSDSFGLENFSIGTNVAGRRDRPSRR